MGWRGRRRRPGTQKERKQHFFVKQTYIEDVGQDEKDVPDLLAAIMRPTCLVKEELRPNLSKMIQFRSEITKIRV